MKVSLILDRNKCAWPRCKIHRHSQKEALSILAYICILLMRFGELLITIQGEKGIVEPEASVYSLLINHDFKGRRQEQHLFND